MTEGFFKKCCISNAMGGTDDDMLWDSSEEDGNVNTFTAIVDLSRFNNSCLKSPASTLVDLTFQSRALRSFGLNQLRNLSL